MIYNPETAGGGGGSYEIATVSIGNSGQWNITYVDEEMNLHEGASTGDNLTTLVGSLVYAIHGSRQPETSGVKAIGSTLYQVVEKNASFL